MIHAKRVRKKEREREGQRDKDVRAAQGKI